MAQIKTDSRHYQNIANKIREKIGGSDTYYPQEMPGGIDEVFEAGMQTEYDRFWDTLQQNGARKDYYFGFAGNCWSKETFKPKYDMQPTNAGNMFAYWNISGAYFEPFDLVEQLEELGVTLDFSKAGGLTSTFNSSKLFTRVGVIETYSNMESTFNSAANLVTIDKLKLSDTGNQTFNTTTFGGCTKLANITFEGVIGNDINFKACPLSVDSMKNIIEHLKNYKNTDNDLTYKLTFKGDCWTALEADSTAPDGTTWREYIDTKLGWLTA